LTKSGNVPKIKGANQNLQTEHSHDKYTHDRPDYHRFCAGG
jgi:hypothetical protein